MEVEAVGFAGDQRFDAKMLLRDLREKRVLGHRYLAWECFSCGFADGVFKAVAPALVGHTRRQMLRGVNELFRDGKMAHMNVILNDVKAGQGYGDGYGYYTK